MESEAHNISETILLSIGTIITLVLMVNAYFTRKTLEKINDVDVKLAIIITDHNNTKNLAKANEESLRIMRDQNTQHRNELMRYISNLRERVGKLEDKD